ncbi:hypothetical protein HFZ78_18665 [Priestia megaterium]|uniref:Uncharacterized protein n=1 Tax=Priestia megaterium TaxID=1404 RepID=A0A6H1P4J3_PRIMG|nr:hypothetical protein [Priestia megaterium]QIZ08479.1 hypothetical protein HFZ78_18665 [Priestia megaterium]
MKKKIIVSVFLSFVVLIGSFYAGNVNKAEAAYLYKYTWPFKTQQMTVKLDTNYSVTGYEVYRGFTNRIGITMNYKVSATTGLKVTNLNYYVYGMMWPVSATGKSKAITKSTASVGGTATAEAIYTAKISGWKSGLVLLTEYPRTDGQLKLVSIDKTKKTAVVKFTGMLRH